jgi:hypothetical protein
MASMHLLRSNDYSNVQNFVAARVLAEAIMRPITFLFYAALVSFLQPKRPMNWYSSYADDCVVIYTSRCVIRAI